MKTVLPHAALLLLAGLPLLGHAADAAPLNDRGRILKALQGSGELVPGRVLVHLSHTCNLQLDGQRFPVIDVRELVRGASTPRGVNRILVLTPALTALQRIPYTDERPMFCRGSRLFVYGGLTLAQRLPEGNVLVLSDKGRKLQVENVDVNDWPGETGQ